ncbi:MAG: hypothetical protein IK104_04880 [Clostridia bacterium]|nr:hypothetical protein [Clostridia bacterium]
MEKLIALLMTIIMFLFPAKNLPEVDMEKETMSTDYTYVFVHGLDGWGEYEFYYKLFPYWGVFGGDLMTYLRARGIDAHGASVNPTASAWDRACELYAQLTGTKVDYGKEHSERCNHQRYGKDYSKNPLIDNWSSEDKINILGHSFGGATVLTLVELMANGSEAERAATPAGELSPLFEGGKGDWFYSVTTLSAPLNGTTAYDAGDSSPKVSKTGATTTFFYAVTPSPLDGRIDDDSARYDMHVDNAIAMVSSFETLENVYYFSIPTCLTDVDENGNSVPDKAHMEVLFQTASEAIGSYKGVTPGGVVLDETWQPNDGLVNTISARAPFGAPQKDLDEANIEPGVWNIFPTYRGDHMALEGGLMKTNEIRQLYTDLIKLINNL